MIHESQDEALQGGLLLLDADSEIVLRCEPVPSDQKISPGWHERHSLLDFGTESLRRFFNSRVLIDNEDPVYRDTANMSIAIALNAASRLSYSVEQRPQEGDVLALFRSLEVESWRVFNAAKLIFQDLDIRKGDLNSMTKLIEGDPAEEIPFPPSLDRYIKKLESVKPKSRFDASQGIKDLFQRLAYLLLALSHVYELDECSEMPIGLSMMLFPHLNSKIMSKRNGPMPIQEAEFSQALCELLVGDRSKHGKRMHDSAFIASDYGWSVILGCVGVSDPADVRPLMFHIRRGIPTNTKTLERKRFVADMTYGDVKQQRKLPFIRVMDTGEKYVPRSLARIV